MHAQDVQALSIRPRLGLGLRTAAFLAFGAHVRHMMERIVRSPLYMFSREIVLAYSPQFGWCRRAVCASSLSSASGTALISHAASGI